MNQTEPDFPVAPPPVTVSASAAERIKLIMAEQPPAPDGGPKALRVAVQGGGCSGFSYQFDFADGPEMGDLVIARDGATVLIDDVSLEFLEGSEIDYVERIIGASFEIKNPNATASCGCGTSFSV